jgi:ubiquinone/menaquinone biosynthesis C-methylase UbiE
MESTVLPWVTRDYDLGDELLEIGPGPGMATNLLKDRVAAVTALEIDPALAESLTGRMAGTNVSVVEGDATAMPFDDNRFSSAISMTMLHHVPSAEMQDKLLRETYRTLRPGGVFVGSDSASNLRFRVIHLFDTCVPVEPKTFGERLEASGFTDVAIREGAGAFRFRAKKG